jgi:hypothetical protein
MGSFSYYAANKVLEHLIGLSGFTMPTSIYVALSTVAITASSTGATITEPATANAYVRQSLAGSAWHSAASGTITNGIAGVTFPEATDSWGTIGYFALVDSSARATGNILAWGSVSPGRTVVAGDIVNFDLHSLTLTLT